MNINFPTFAAKFDNLETTLPNDIVAVTKTADSAMTQSNDNKSTIEQLQQEFGELKGDHQIDIDTKSYEATT